MRLSTVVEVPSEAGLSKSAYRRAAGGNDWAAGPQGEFHQSSATDQTEPSENMKCSSAHRLLLLPPTPC